jgi:hypothetical protein
MFCVFNRDLIKLLRSRGTAVYLVSGGFRALIHPLARHLDIPVDNVYANTILFDAKGLTIIMMCPMPAIIACVYFKESTLVLMLASSPVKLEGRKGWLNI